MIQDHSVMVCQGTNVVHSGLISSLWMHHDPSELESLIVI